MAIPKLARIAPLPDPQVLNLPGGASIEHIRLAEVVQPALTPLMPFFNILEAFMALVKCVQAVPDTFGPPPDPTALITALENLAKKLGKLLKLVPQLSLPVMILGLVDLVLHVLADMRDALVHMQERSEAVSKAEARATELGDEQLAAIAQLARDNLAQEAANRAKELGALGTLMQLLGMFSSMAGGPKMPSLDDMGAGPMDEMVAMLDGLVTALQGVRKAIPVP